MTNERLMCTCRLACSLHDQWREKGTARSLVDILNAVENVFTDVFILYSVQHIHMYHPLADSLCTNKTNWCIHVSVDILPLGTVKPFHTPNTGVCLPYKDVGLIGSSPSVGEYG